MYYIVLLDPNLIPFIIFCLVHKFTSEMSRSIFYIFIYSIVNKAYIEYTTSIKSKRHGYPYLSISNIKRVNRFLSLIGTCLYIYTFCENIYNYASYFIYTYTYTLYNACNKLLLS